MTDIKKSLRESMSDFGIPTDEDMEKISLYTKKALSRDELFVFSVTLCDNDIDRDNERFTEDCLSELVPLMKGATGICDHDPKAKNQTARLFDCFVTRSDSEKTKTGSPLMRLTGRAYMLRTEKNADAIAQIEGGILKEVSISCSVKSQRCSVCGKDIRVCGHLKGHTYGDKVCYSELSQPSDGYEWSFVAVPAQKNAGVTKSRKDVKGLDTTLFKSIKEGCLTEICDEVILSCEEAMELSSIIKELSSLASCGREYLDSLRSETKKLSVAAEISIPDSVFEKMSLSELTETKKSLSELCSKQFPVKPQLYSEAVVSEKSDLDGFKI